MHPTCRIEDRPARPVDGGGSTAIHTQDDPFAKKKTSRTAWYDDLDETTSYNLFKKIRSRSRHSGHDVEKGDCDHRQLRRVRSDNRVRHEVEVDRYQSRDIDSAQIRRVRSDCHVRLPVGTGFPEQPSPAGNEGQRGRTHSNVELDLPRWSLPQKSSSAGNEDQGARAHSSVGLDPPRRYLSVRLSLAEPSLGGPSLGGPSLGGPPLGGPSLGGESLGDRRRTVEAGRSDGAEAMYSATSDDDFRPPADNNQRRKKRKRVDIRRMRPHWLGRRRTESPASEGTSSSSSGANRKRHCSIPVGSQLRAIFLSSWVNLLLLAVPAGIVLHFLFRHEPSVGQSRITFALNALAVVPLTGMVAYFVDELALRSGKTFGGLLAVLFGNVAELLIGSFALFRHEAVLVKSFMAGTIVFEMLLLLGASFVFGGMGRIEQIFNGSATQHGSLILLLGIGTLLLPSAFSYRSNQGGQTELSHATAVILLIMHIAFLFFQLKTHVDLYNAPTKKVKINKKKVQFETKSELLAAAAKGMDDTPSEAEEQLSPSEVEEDPDARPQLCLSAGLVSLIVSVALLGICSKALVDSVDGVTRSNTLSPSFVGFILLPILSNIGKSTAAITMAVRDKTDLAIGVCVGTSIRITLFTYPLLVTMGWMARFRGNPLLFDLDGFQSITLLGSVLVPFLLIQDGKSHWLEGSFFVAAYVAIAVAMWFDSP